jgi:iron only hydrogenase large subunit-like protein
MACPGGCINGGGQTINASEESVKARMQTLYDIDEKDSIKTSHQNPYIKELYEKFLGEPLSHKSHELLHTTYKKREDIMI